jgi:predicted secreted protein
MQKLIEIWQWEARDDLNVSDWKADMRVWREMLLGLGAKSVELYSGSYGRDDKSWIVTVEHESSEAWGRFHDKFRAWQVSPEAAAIAAKMKVKIPLEWAAGGMWIGENL